LNKQKNTDMKTSEGEESEETAGKGKKKKSTPVFV